ncbi:NADP-dependent oxidoreductase domain-containing protein [Mycena belliarum]|uniref:NADP-dependent oxidoreductase domain-containing protein n=1 Tax=Mycena belliarum TaxID=1033014 RepID=A0AAD6TYA3_9AGAR|nr:NADP-dependent oxidoreductase domain-containing protein [Mycena belliae]
MPSSSYPTRRLGLDDGPLVSAIGLGAMGLGGLQYGSADEESVLNMLTSAADSGVTFWDTADAYGDSEATIGKWFRKFGRRSEIFLSTKFGGKDFTENAENPYRPNSQPSHVKARIASSLALLSFPDPEKKEQSKSYIDLYFQHRVDPDTPIEVVLETLRPFIEAGQIRYVGLSDCGIEMLRRAKAVPGVGEKVVAVQVEFSPFEREAETSGFVEEARTLGVTIVPYSPLGRGMISGNYKSRADFEATDIRLNFMPRFSEANFATNLKLVDQFKAVAQQYAATPAQIALAWILRAYPDFVPIPGTRSAQRVKENAEAALIKLSDEDFGSIDLMVRSAEVKGAKIAPQFESATSCIAMAEWKGETQRTKKA